MSKVAEQEWVDSNFFVNGTALAAPVVGPRNAHESSRDLREGCEVEELDTIPMELLEFFK